MYTMYWHTSITSVLFQWLRRKAIVYHPAIVPDAYAICQLPFQAWSDTCRKEDGKKSHKTKSEKGFEDRQH